MTRIQCGPSHDIVTGVAKFFDAPMLFVFDDFSFTECRCIEHCITVWRGVEILYLLNDQYPCCFGQF